MPRHSNESLSSAQGATGKSPRAFILLLLIVLFSAIGIAVFAYWFFVMQYYETTDNAYIGGNIVPFSSQIPGTVTEVLVRDTDYVKAGALIARLDSADAELEVLTAKSKLAQVVRDLRSNQGGGDANIAQADASIDQARSELKKTEAEYLRIKNDLQRKRELRTEKFISEEVVSNLETALRSADASRQAARAAVQNTVSGLQKARASRLSDGTSIETNPRVLIASAAFKEAFLNLKRTELRAPVNGQIAKSTIQPGQQIRAGQNLMLLIDDGERWVEANFKETELANVRPGQPVTLFSDLYGSNIKYKGKVVGLSSGTGSVFALLPPQNASGNWIKIVQRLMVRVAIDKEQLSKYPLSIGLSIKVQIDTHDRRGKTMSVADNTDNIRRTDVFNNMDKEADQMLHDIIAANRH